MGYMKEKVAYLRGLAEGMEIGGDPQGKLVNAIIAVMDEMADSVDDLEVAAQEVDECLDELYEEVDSIEEDLYGDEDDDDEDFVEIECPNCGETVYFDQSMLESDEDLICPNCNEPIVPAFSDDEE